jgi:CHAT domain-containing protein
MLWDVAVGPVLEELGFTSTPKAGDSWPRVWWASGGMFSIFPLHAAGYHQSGSTNNALDRVISSYTPTIKALTYARQQASKVVTEEMQQMLLVGMPSTPGQSDLPFVEKEIQEINAVIPHAVQRVILLDCRKEEAIAEVTDSQIVHFSCHGRSSAEDPSKSQLLLRNWQTDPLSVGELSTLNLKKAQFAFLSSCYAAKCLDLKLLDESIHLSAAFQLAGFPYVVGTLWQVTDYHSAIIARDVYAHMSKGGKKIEVSRSAEALHLAVRRLRGESQKVAGISRAVPDDPILWAGYIHMGA